MSKFLILQVISSLGALGGILLVYVGLSRDIDALSLAALALFAVSLLVTPALKLVPKRLTDQA